MDRKKFFDSIRSEFGKLTKSQVDGLSRICDEAQIRGTPLRHLAYILATAKHETADKYQPIREMGGEKYLRSKRYYPWVGEGLVQVTWEENHRKFGATAPGQMMTWPIALRAIFDGMTKGMFTGKKMSDYLSSDFPDYRGARRIVNGTDKAALIAGYAVTFQTALREAGYVGQKPQTLSPGSVAAPPAPVPPSPAPKAPEPRKRAPEPRTGRSGLLFIITAIIAAIGAWLGFGG